MSGRNTFSNSGMGSVRAFIGLGSNVGDREANIEAALEWISSHEQIELRSRTELIETEPWGLKDQPSFINAVAEVVTNLGPHQLLGELKRAEGELGRIKASQMWGPREIDLDILLYGEMILNTPELKIPHVHLTEREFVVKQLVSLDADVVHPKFRVPIKSFLFKKK